MKKTFLKVIHGSVHRDGEQYVSGTDNDTFESDNQEEIDRLVAAGVVEVVGGKGQRGKGTEEQGEGTKAKGEEDTNEGAEPADKGDEITFPEERPEEEEEAKECIVAAMKLVVDKGQTTANGAPEVGEINALLGWDEKVTASERNELWEENKEEE